MLFRRSNKCLQKAFRNQGNSTQNGKANRHVFSLGFFSDSGPILGTRISQNFKKKLLGSTPGAFLKPSWCPETFLKRPGLDFGAPKTRFWKAWDSFLKGCGHHVGVCCELFSIASFFFNSFFVRTNKRTYVCTYVLTSVRMCTHVRMHLNALSASAGFAKRKQCAGSLPQRG